MKHEEEKGIAQILQCKVAVVGSQSASHEILDLDSVAS